MVILETCPVRETLVTCLAEENKKKYQTLNHRITKLMMEWMTVWIVNINLLKTFNKKIKKIHTRLYLIMLINSQL
jgi:hypothetical protein